MNEPLLENSSEPNQIVAIGIVIRSFEPHSLARHSGMRLADVQAALDRARRSGLIDDSDTPSVAVSITDALSAERVARLHESVCRHLLTEGPEHLEIAIEHARSASSHWPSEEILQIAEQAARTSLSVSDYASARALLDFTEEFGYIDSSTARATRLLLLADALEGLGLVVESKSAAARAFDLAEISGDSRLASQAAIRYSLPVDWYAGDPRAVSLLQRAQVLSPPDSLRPSLAAARALVEMRIPTTTIDGQQVAWVTRASVAQPFADEALRDSASLPDAERILPLLAWRNTHRAPRHLRRRREASRAALDMAQRLRQPTRQVEAAAMLAVDSLESGDRAQYDDALGVARWVARRDGNPRLLWHSTAMAAAAALMSLDLDQADRLRIEAAEHGKSVSASSWLTADLTLLGQLVLLRDGEQEISRYLVPEDTPWLSHVMARFSIAIAYAMCGETSVAERFIRIGLRQMDEETSILLAGTLAAHAVCLIDVPDLVEPVLGLLVPWSDHVAIDANAWYTNGPVSLAIAELHLKRGDLNGARDMLHVAEPLATSIGCIKARHRIDALKGALGFGASASAPNELLTDRERIVLTKIIAGETNVKIAAELSFSTSTIRNDTSAIYKKLGVTGRAEAAAKAIALGLVENQSSAHSPVTR